jgi:hypothetical protein
MAEPNWHKQVAIGTWALLIFGIVTYVFPADPAHPMSLDFLSKSIAVPPWMAVTIGFGLIVATGSIVRWYVYRSLPIAPISSNSAFVKENDQLKAQVVKLSAELAKALNRQARTIPVEDLKREKQIYDLTTALRDTTNELQPATKRWISAGGRL